MQNRSTELQAIIVLGFIASAGFGLAAIAMLAWIGTLLRELKGDNDADD